MHIQEFDPKSHTIRVAIPLTTPSGKTRVKRRGDLKEYGQPHAARQNPFTRNCYIEWQIGYDAPITDEEKVRLTTLHDKTFVGANGQTKYLYELSEYLDYFFRWGDVSRADLVAIRDRLSALPPAGCLDKHPALQIGRSPLAEKEINDLRFRFTEVKYPLLIHEFENSELLAEIVIKEKQRAIGTQPMLYLCFPLTALENGESYFGRTAAAKEEATLRLDASASSLLLEMLALFGTLTANHKQDVISILNLILS